MTSKTICVLTIIVLSALVFVVAEARGGGRRGSSHGSSIFRRSNKKHGNSGSSSHHSSSNIQTSKSYSQPHHVTSNTRQRTHSWGFPSSFSSYYSLLPAVKNHISHQWGGHSLKPNHIFITQPSNMPAHALYYARPPTYRSSTGDSTDFALGYLVGRSFSHGPTQHHYVYSQQEPQQADRTSKTLNSKSKHDIKTSTETFYWPTESEVPLAPLNITLVPDTHTLKSTEEVIFKKPPITTAQIISVNNISYELPSANAPPPETPPSYGIFCMPWTFNETDARHPEHIGTVTKTVCFPAPPQPPPPLPTQTTTSGLPGNCAGVQCSKDMNFSDLIQNPCCFTEERVIDLVHKSLPFLA